MDNAYYLRREAQERLLAARTTNVTARRIHLELAEHYARRIAPARLALVG